MCSRIYLSQSRLVSLETCSQVNSAAIRSPWIMTWHQFPYHSTFVGDFPELWWFLARWPQLDELPVISDALVPTLCHCTTGHLLDILRGHYDLTAGTFIVIRCKSYLYWNFISQKNFIKTKNRRCHWQQKQQPESTSHYLAFRETLSIGSSDNGLKL